MTINLQAYQVLCILLEEFFSLAKRSTKKGGSFFTVLLRKNRFFPALKRPIGLILQDGVGQSFIAVQSDSSFITLIYTHMHNSIIYSIHIIQSYITSIHTHTVISRFPVKISQTFQNRLIGVNF